jgi:membrane fusion protein (multidrug efflux system)
MSQEEKERGGRKQRIASVVLWSALAFVVVAIVLTVKMKPQEEQVVVAPERAVLVRTQRVVPQAISDVVVLPGWVEADASVWISIEKNGRVVELPVDRGDEVKAGQVLLRVDARHWNAKQKQAAIELADAERDLARWKKLKEKGAVSSSDYDAIQRRRDLAEVSAEEIEVDLSQCTITSSIDGVVNARHVELGEYVSEAQAVFEIVSADKLNVAVNVPEKDVHAVVEGAMLRLRSAVLPDAFTGRVEFVAINGAQPANTFAMELAVESPPPALKPGMIVDVELIRAERENAVVVPFSAVIPKRGEHIVFVVVEDRAVLRVVQIDAIIGKNVVLMSGLESGDQLVIEGQRTLQDGVMVVMASDAEREQE